MPRIKTLVLCNLGIALMIACMAACQRRESARDRAKAAKTFASAATAELLARNIPAETDRNAVWRRFRAAYPYHMQVLALSDSAPDGSRALIVAEPPPHVSEADVLAPLAPVARGHTVERQRIGYDGWVRDVVITVAGDEAQIDQSVSALYRRLFLTTYKAYVLPLPVPPSAQHVDLDLHVTAAELNDWLIASQETYSGPESDSISFENLTHKQACGVYASTHGGLVGWWIPKNIDVDACRASVRQFALDSDLIVGALAASGGTLVLGRERVVPVDVLPPLRAETVSLLAWAARNGAEGQLAQSYERNALFAGRMDATHDWAPILLSPELRETEYGSLLDITDQLLKGWSNAGTTHYVNFEYPRPAAWPFASPLFTHLGVHQVVYNWNTAGATYTVDLGDAKVLALNRTGALPVSYIPEGTSAAHPAANVMAAEDRAYEYFAGLSDPNLTRVVQYAALYQIFSAFGVRNRPVATGGEYAQKRIEEVTRRLTASLVGANDEQLRRLSHAIAPTIAQSFGAPSQTEAAEKLALRELESFQRTSGVPKSLEARVVLSAIAGEQNLPSRYARDVSANLKGWIHTPTVVVSWNDAIRNGIIIGGHNIDARVTEVAVSDRVSPGSIEIDDGGVIRVNKRDASRVKGAIRAAGRFERAPPEIRRQRIIDSFASFPVRPSRPRTDALRLPSGEREGARLSLLDTAAGWARQKRIGWFRCDPQPALVPRNSAQIVVLRSASKYTIQHGSSSAIDAYTVGSATDAVNALLRDEKLASDSVAMELRNFKDKEGTAFLRSCEIRAHADGSRRVLSAHLMDEGMSEESMAALRSLQFDFSGATVREKSIEATDAGLETGITIDIPVVDRKSKASLEVDLTFDRNAGKGTVRMALSRITAWARDFIARQKASIDAFFLNHQVNQAIKRIGIETKTGVIGVRQTFKHGQHDVHFAELREEHGAERRNSSRPS